MVGAYACLSTCRSTIRSRSLPVVVVRGTVCCAPSPDHRVLRRCRGQDSNLHGGCPPRDFKSLASTDFATPAGLKYSLAPHAARRMHHVDRRLATVRGEERPPDLSHNFRLTLPSLAGALAQQDQHRAAPSRTGESGAERASTPRGGHDRI